MSQTPDGTHPPEFSARQRAVIRHLAAGLTPLEVADLVRGVTPAKIKRWFRSRAFKDAVRGAATHEGAIEDFLSYGEEVAVLTAIEVMSNAVDGKGRPDYKTRLEAAIELLNRKGQRGMPVQSTETKQLVVHGDMNKALDQALRDPGVKAWLDTQPATVGRLTKMIEETHQIAAPAGDTGDRGGEAPESLSPVDFEIVEG